MTAKNEFVADGYRRFMRGKKAWTLESLEAKYAAELAHASPGQKLEIHKRMVAESLRREKAMRHKPSSATLW
jgi:hypothetical protein